MDTVHTIQAGSIPADLTDGMATPILTVDPA